jgi:putative heme transporter
VGRFEQVRANIRRAYEQSRATVRAAREQEIHRYEAVAPEPVVPPVEPDVHHSTASRDDLHVPYALRIAGAWGWRLIIVTVVLLGLLTLFGRLSIVIVPLVIALLLSALLGPAVGWLKRLRLPQSLATAIVVVGGLAAVVATLTLVVNQFINGVPDLTDNAGKGITQIQNWLKNGPLHLSDNQLDNMIKEATETITNNKDGLTTGAISTATTAFEVFSGMVLVLFSLFFFLRDGRQIWLFCVRLLPAKAREPLDHAAVAGWRSLGSYVRATVIVAFIDAVGIGIALVVMKVNFALPLAALVFLGAFIPIIGATLSGSVAVLVALVDKGLLTALVILAAVIVVQQVEGHLLQPLIMGRAVAIHPLAVIVAIAAGVVLAGIVGALIAVPIIAVLNSAIRHLASHQSNPPPNNAEPVKTSLMKPA